MIVILILIFLNGCAIGPHRGDPFESINRKIYTFNYSVDKSITKPIAKTYSKYAPNVAKHGIRNFFQNLGMISTALNNIFQLKLHKTPDDLLRITLNSTVGVGGLFDIATRLGIPKNNEDFGQTLGHWGVRSGPYLMIPFVGPTTVRDGLGRPLDVITNPVSSLISDPTTTYSLTALQITDTRARLLTVSDIIDQQLDPYAFIRDNFLDRRASLVEDRHPNNKDESPGALVPEKSLLEMEKELFGDEPLGDF